MVFIPFTGVDNHKKSVTLAAGLMCNEDTDSYIWILECFKKAMDFEPRILITDEDKAMRAAVAIVFPNTHHRFCMWHITEKLKEKVGVHLATNTDFLKDISSVIWNDYIEPPEFENRWTNVIQKYGLQEHKWFKTKYNERSSWIPAYFRDIELGGLLRTTSRSESENSFFGRYLHVNLTLVEFYLCFKTALKAQRHERLKLDHDSKNTKIVLKTPLKIEKHAATIYTQTIFKEIQNEIERAVYQCTIEGVAHNENEKTFMVKDKECNSRTFEVVFRISGSYINCTCKKYMKVGILCCHSFHVLNAVDTNEIPNSLITKRWLKTTATVYGDEATTNANSSLSILNRIQAEVSACIISANNDPKKLEDLLEKIKKIREEFTIDNCGENISKAQFFESVIGMEAPADIIIKAPDVARTKGCGKRFKSTRELSIEKSKKQKRMCSYCKTMDFHDSRNCPKKKSDSVTNEQTENCMNATTQEDTNEIVNLSVD